MTRSNYLNATSGSRERALFALDFGQLLIGKFEKTNRIGHLNDAIVFLNEANNFEGDDQTFRKSTVLWLQSCLVKKFQKTGEVDCLNAAILVLQTAVQVGLAPSVSGSTVTGNGTKCCWLLNNHS